MRIQIKAIGAHGKSPEFEEIGKAIKKKIEGPIAEKLHEYADNAVSGWDVKPIFRVTKKITTSEVWVAVIPTGPGRDRWIWTSRGTKPHTIKPKKAGGVLAFRTDYAPHTQAHGPSYGGPGIATGPWVHAKVVHHPGTKARNFEKAWARWSKTWYPRMIDEAIKEGIKRTWANRK